jgi:pyruvate formate lyase activating enzyme
MTGIIFHIQRFSVNDGPGIRTTVFFKGCPLRCLWCHNPESISSGKQLLLREERCIRCGDCLQLCKNGAIRKVDGRYVTDRDICIVCGTCLETCYADAREIVGREMTTEEVLFEVEKDRVFYDRSGGGVTVSGGEPLFQHEFLLSLLTASKEKSIHTTVDTTGYTSPDILERLSTFVDLFLYDLKSLDDNRHREFTGVSNRLILENLNRLVRWGKRVIVRIPLIPGVNDDGASIREIGSYVKNLGGVSEIHLLPFHTTGDEKYRRLGMEHRFSAAPSPDHVQAVISDLKKYVDIVNVGG